MDSSCSQKPRIKRKKKKVVTEEVPANATGPAIANREIPLGFPQESRHKKRKLLLRRLNKGH